MDADPRVLFDLVAKTRFAEFLAAKGRKFTVQMARVADVALSKVGTFAHDNIVAETHGEISRATVYRTLSHMVQAGVLRVTQVNGREVFVCAVHDV